MIAVAGGLATVLTGAGVVALWLAPSSGDRQWVVLWEFVVGIGLAVAGLMVTARLRPFPPGPLLGAAGLLLLTGPPLTALGQPELADLLAVLAVAVAVPLALLRIVPGGRADRSRRFLEVLVAVAGATCAVATALGMQQVVVGAGLAGACTLFCAGWLQFEITTGDARRQVLWVVLGCSVAILPATMILMVFDDVPPSAGITVAVLFLAVPLTAAIAALAPRTVDVRAVISKAVVATVMLTVAVAAFRGAQAAITLVAGRPPGNGTLSLLAVAVAAAFQPVLLRVRTGVEELLFGGRADPVNTLSRLGVQLTAGSSPGLAGHWE